MWVVESYGPSTFVGPVAVWAKWAPWLCGFVGNVGAFAMCVCGRSGRLGYVAVWTMWVCGPYGCVGHVDAWAMWWAARHPLAHWQIVSVRRDAAVGGCLYVAIRPRRPCRPRRRRRSYCQYDTNILSQMIYANP